eukprot:458783_1
MATKTSLPMNIGEILSSYDIFITGASGFVGIAFLEKLLRLHSKINNGNIRKMNARIFILLRPNRKYKRIESRLMDEMLSNALFNEYNQSELQYLANNKKLIPINGDLGGDMLGVPQDDITLMKQSKNILFCHCAADVAFDPPFNSAMNINVNGTYQCIQLAKMVNAKGFLHISTLYVNSREKNESTVYERIYEQGFNGVDAFQKWLNGHKLDNNYIQNEIKSKYNINDSTQFKQWPNHYTLTKNIAEQCVQYYCRNIGLRYSIARLGVIGPYTGKDPAKKGWYYSNGAGFVAFSAGAALGYIQYMNTDGSGRLDFVPIDYTVNAMCGILATFDDKYYFNKNCYHDIYQIGVLIHRPNHRLIDIFDYVHYHDEWEPGKKHPRIKYITNKYYFDLIQFLKYDIPLYLLWPIVIANRIIYGDLNSIDVNKLNDIEKIEYELKKINPNKLTKIAKQIESGASQKK